MRFPHCVDRRIHVFLVAWIAPDLNPVAVVGLHGVHKLLAPSGQQHALHEGRLALESHLEIFECKLERKKTWTIEILTNSEDRLASLVS